MTVELQNEYIIISKILLASSDTYTLLNLLTHMYTRLASASVQHMQMDMHEDTKQFKSIAANHVNGLSLEA